MQLGPGAAPGPGPTGFPDGATLPARFLPLLSSYLAMARKANSTFMPVLALVSMKGTPYSLASVSPSSKRITLSLLTSACQAQVGHSGEGNLDPSWPLSAPAGPLLPQEQVLPALCW